MRFALWTNSLRDPQGLNLKRLVGHLEDRGVSWTTDVEDFESCDLLISLGGDGTFLSAAHPPVPKLLPSVGLNLGSVGFLTEIEPQFMEEAVDQLVDGNYEVEDRMMLEARIMSSEGACLAVQTALNDVVLSRAGSSRILSIDLSISGNHVERIPGDGLIVSTPTGSTAYSLAAGGPIVHPSMELMLITPVCPHSLHNRTYVAPPDAEIEMRLVDSEADAVCCADGRKTVRCNDSVIEVRKAKEPFRLIKIYGDRFYQRLPGKIQQRGNLQ